MTSDRSQLFVLRGVLPDPEQHVILDEVISKEPLSPAVRDNDADFFKLIRWVIFSLIQAEEWGLTKDNIDQQSIDNSDVRKFLGHSKNVASSIGIEQSFVSQMLKETGNYGDIYDRNLGDSSAIKIARQQNGLWGQDCGLMYAIPSR